MTDSELKLLLEKQELLLRKLLELSQRQFAESDAVALDELLKQKDSYFDELQKLDPLREKWHKKYNRPLGQDEQKLDEIPALAVPLAIGAIRAAPTVAKFVSRGGGAPVGAAAASAVDKVKGGIRKVRKRLSRRKEEFEVDENIDERALTKTQQDRLDDLEAFLQHLQN